MTDETGIFLLVEDSPDDVALFVHILQKANQATLLRVATDGEAALKLLFRDGDQTDDPPPIRPRVIILDLKLPKVSGLEVLRRLKSDPRTRCIPVVVFSSSQEERDLAECYKLGANSYLVKPLNFDALGETVRAMNHYWLNLNKTPAPQDSSPIATP